MHPKTLPFLGCKDLLQTWNYKKTSYSCSTSILQNPHSKQKGLCKFSGPLKKVDKFHHHHHHHSKADVYIHIYQYLYIDIYIYIKTDSHSTKITVNRIMSNSTTRISRNGRSEQKHIVDSNPRCVSRFNDSKRRTTGERSVGLVPPTYQQIFCPCRWVSPKIFFRKYTANKELSKKVLQLKQGL